MPSTSRAQAIVIKSTMTFSLATLVFFLFPIHFPLVFSHGPVFIRDGQKSYSQIEIPGVIGPESIEFDCHGQGPYIGVSDGRILKWQGANLGWTQFAVTSPHRNKRLCDGSTDPNNEPECGRPLGLKFNTATCELYIADAYIGLLKVGPNGGVAQQLATCAEGLPFRFTNGLDIDSRTGVVYFTDSSVLFQRRVRIFIVVTNDRTGRLLKYDPGTKKVEVLLRGLAFPNGVALSKDHSFLVLAESSTLEVLKVHLQDPKHSVEIFSQLAAFPDNIKRNPNGDFWIGLNTGRGRMLNLENTENWRQEGNVVDSVAVRLDEKGNVLEFVDGKFGEELDSVSEVKEQNGGLWIGSVVKPYVGFLKIL